MANPIDGGPGNDPLFGTGNDDIIRGFGGNDQLFGGQGLDALYGGDDDDSLYGENGVDTLYGGDGNDRLQGVGSAVLLSTGGPCDVLEGGAGIDVMVVSYVSFTGPDGHPPAISVDIRTGQGEVGVGGFRGENFSGIERLEFSGAEGDDRATGGKYADMLDGRGGDDILRAGDGNDVVKDTWGQLDADGGKGTDRLELRLDIFQHDDLGGTLIDGGNGTMLVGGVDWGTFRGFEALTVQLGHGADTVIGLSSGVNIVNGGFATRGAKTIHGGSLGDQLAGGLDADALYGGAGNDSLNGWGGANSLFGGAGDDAISVVGGADRIVAGEGNDIVNGGGLGCNIDLGAGNDTMFLYEQAQVSAETYRGGLGTDIFRIYFQNAVLDFTAVTLTGFEVLEFVDYGHALNLTMILTTAQLAQFGRLAYGSIGGENDNLVIRLADNADVVLPEATELTGLELAAGGQLVDLRQVNSAHIPWVKGGAGDDTVLGPAVAGAFHAELGGGHDRFTGLAAADEVTGGNGNDSLSGASSQDSLSGDFGRDTLLGGAGGDLLMGGLGGDVITGGVGADTLVYNGAADSTGLVHDQVRGFDFSADRFDVGGGVTDVGAEVSGRLRQATFNADLEQIVDEGRLEAGQAILFRATSGDRAGDLFVVIDRNAEDGYQAGEDLLIRLLAPASLSQLDQGDFV